ncbi:MAG: hypothetical protein HN467_08830, partial [Opitutae bacterium]|nr:hypothetical protein [Opitutae bacterium]
HVYVTGRYGKTVVLERSKEFKIVETNILKDRFDSSPSIAGGQLFLRGHRFLYCIGKVNDKLN